MDLNVKTTALCINEKLTETSSEQTVECDITLPDYCPDVKKILKCNVKPSLVSSSFSGDRVNIEANANIRIIYSGEDNEIYSYEKTLPFSKSMELGVQADDPFAQVTLKTSYVNARAVSARKIDVNSSIGVDVTVNVKKNEQIVSDTGDSSVELLKNCRDVCSFVGETSRNFTLNETVDIGDVKGPVSQIIFVDSSITSKETKAANNKVLVKGEIKISVLYSSDGSQKRQEIFEHTMPISQIIELEGVNDKTINNAVLVANNVEVSAKENSSGEKKLLDITADITAKIKSNILIGQDLPTDCYSTKYDLKTEKKLIKLEGGAQKISDVVMVKSNEKISGVQIDEIYSIWCDDVKANSRVSDGELKVNGSMNVCILGKDSSSIPFYTEKTIDFENSRQIKADSDDPMESKTFADVLSVGYILSSEDTVDLRIETVFESFVYTLKPVELITSIDADENSKKQTTPSFTIYFSDDGETLWDIARNFNTTVQAIREENELDSSEVVERRILFIPIM